MEKERNGKNLRLTHFVCPHLYPSYCTQQTVKWVNAMRLLMQSMALLACFGIICSAMLIKWCMNTVYSIKKK